MSNFWSEAFGLTIWELTQQSDIGVKVVSILSSGSAWGHIVVSMTEIQDEALAVFLKKLLSAAVLEIDSYVLDIKEVNSASNLWIFGAGSSEFSSHTFYSLQDDHQSINCYQQHQGRMLLPSISQLSRDSSMKRKLWQVIKQQVLLEQN